MYKYLPFLFLIGCSSQLIKEPVPVKIPIPIQCEVKSPTKPIFIARSLPKEASRVVWLKAKITDSENLGSYSLKLETALSACN